MPKKYFIFLFILFNSCAIFSNLTKRHSKISINQIQNLNPGKDSQSEILVSLEKPGFKAANEGHFETWAYFNDETKTVAKLTLKFSPDSKLLYSFFWSIAEAESESTLKGIKKRFPNSKFIVRKPPWINPHFEPDQIYYDDDSLGLRVIYSKTEKRFTSFIQTLPGTSMTKFDPKSDPDTKITFGFTGKIKPYSEAKNR